MSEVASDFERHLRAVEENGGKVAPPARRPVEAGDDDTFAEVNKIYAFPEGHRVVGALKRGDGDEETVYVLILEDGQAITLGRAPAVYDPRKWDERILPYTAPFGHDPRSGTRADLRPAAVTVLREAKHDEISGDQTEETLEWLAAFCKSPTAVRDEDGTPRETAPLDVDYEKEKEKLYLLLLHDQPVFGTTDGRLFVNLGDFKQYVKRKLHENESRKEIERRLIRLGFARPNKEGKVSAQHPDDGQQETRGVFLISPPGFTGGLA